MSFADEMKKKSKDNDKEAQKRRAEQASIDHVDAWISKSIEAIKNSCNSAAEKGKHSVKGLVYDGSWSSSDYYYYELSQRGAFIPASKEEEKQIIDGIYEGVKSLGFKICRINCSHEHRVYSESILEKIKDWQNNRGIYIEVYIKW